MAKKTSTTTNAEHAFEVHGTVRDAYHQPLTETTVKAYSKSLRGKHLLGEAVTDALGQYTIGYTLKKADTAGVFVCIFENGKTVLKESEIHYDVQANLQIDIDLGDVPFTGLSEFEQLLQTVAPFTEDHALAEVTETAEKQHISFIIQKTGLLHGRVEKLAMAARFETLSSIPAQIWYGILQENLPDSRTLRAIGHAPLSPDFETKLIAVFDALMHTPVAALTKGIEYAINENIIGRHVTAELPAITEQLNTQVLAYAQKHPITGKPSLLHQKLELGGLKGKELASFIDVHNSHTDTDGPLWEKAKNHTTLRNSKNIDQVEAVFHLSSLTGDNIPLTEILVKDHKIRSKADVKKLAAHDRNDWETLVTEQQIKPDKTIRGESQAEKIKNYAAHLENMFTLQYPTTSFAARLEKDKKSQLPHRDKISKFLQQNEHFDLLQHPVGKFLQDNKDALPENDATEVANHLHRVQRVFKLAPSYDTTQVLMNDNIHSAHQVYKMGKDNFVNTYADKLGKNEATQIFQKASAVHANALALIGNLKSLSDASTLNAFPNFSLLLNEQLAVAIPSLETLFGHADFCDCQECSSVYGAPAYLTDILHFLNQRLSTLDFTAPKVPSVKDLLLKRRPDIADIDLECHNTNIEIPYIDVACEIMEDYIAPPVVTLANSFLPSLVKGTIATTLLTELRNQFSTSGQTNISNLLTEKATVSKQYSANRLQADNTFLSQNHWVIRDSQVTLRASAVSATSTIEFRLLHQTLFNSDDIATGPEYINTLTYNNFLRTAKRPFNLPFDLFETEGKLYLEKLGVKKADLINIFRKEDKLAPGASTFDLSMGYASLNICETEVPLIFTADPTHQALYWGDAIAGSTTIQVNVFEKATGLNYEQVVNLVQLQFINPAKDSFIQHDDLSCDTTKKRITNITTTRLDAIHRFLRLWRKTSFTMDELDAIIVSSAIGTNKIQNKLAWQLQQFTSLQQTLSLSTFELLAFYQNLDTTHNLPGCLYNQLFQNSQITNPVSARFTIAAATPGTSGINELDKSVIAAALQVSITDVNALILKTISRISFPALSGMFRHAQLARSLQLSVTDFLTLLNLINVNPFADLQSTTLFIQKFKLLQSSRFSIDELNYLLRHQNDAGQTLVPSNTQVAGALSQLQSELLAVRADTQVTADPDGVLLNKWLLDPVFKWDSRLPNKLLDLLNTVDDDEYQAKVDSNNNFLLNLRLQYHDTFLTVDLAALPLTQTAPVTTIEFPASIASQLTFDADKKQLRLAGYINTADKTALLALSPDTAWQTAINLLFTAAQQTDSSAANIFFAAAADINTNLRNLPFTQKADRFAFFISRLAPVYRKGKQRDVLVKNISSWFNTDKKVIEQLLVSVPVIYTEFTDDNFVNKITAAPYTVQFNRYLYVAKVCFIAVKLRLTDVDLAFLLAHAADMGSLDISALPLAPLSTAATTFPGFEALVNLLQFQQYYPARVLDPVTKATYSIYTILKDAISKGTLTGDALVTYKNNLVTNLSFLTNWKVADLNVLLNGTGTLYLGLTLPADLKSVPVLMRLHQRFALLQQLDISAADAISWIKATLTIDDTTKIKQTLKLKYGHTDWIQVTQPLQNTLREKKRDALIAYLLANPGSQTWKNANDLYSYFLLDVEMCSCQPTSRIVQATNSVQLFVQRCFLNLEDNILINVKTDPNIIHVPIDTNWLQWEWMKNFRVWQANMKVFLYPENWIEPELLPDVVKSPFLKELENDLLQNEATANNVEDTFHSYLEKLSSVARLEVKGMWYDQPSKTLHVFARTFGGNPKIYYYRQLINDRRWTPWVKVDLDINSDHIIPAVYNNRLYLFWAVITEVADQVQTFDVPRADQTNILLKAPAKKWQIQLAFSEYKNGKWTPTKISPNDPAGSNLFPQKDSAGNVRKKENYFFVPLDVPDFDYSSIFVPNTSTRIGTMESFNRKAGAAISANGKLVISCYYYKYVNNASFDNNTYITSFQLDPVKGYPTQLRVNYQVKLFQASSHSERTSRKSEMINMLDVESYTLPGAPVAPTNGIPGTSALGSTTNGPILVAEQAGGAFSNVIPMQMETYDRSNFMTGIWNGGATPGYQIQIELGLHLPYFYQDRRRSYYIHGEYSDQGTFEFLYSRYLDGAFVYLLEGTDADTAFRAQFAGKPFVSRYFNFHHPLVDYFTRRLFFDGIDGLMDRDTQLKGDFGYDPSPDKFSFHDYFQPVITLFNTVYSGSALPPVIHNGIADTTPGYPKDNVDFNLQSGYGMYNWELFFHAPLMIAERLSQNQQFEDANRWYRYIFNPMDVSTHAAPKKYWNTQPFFFNVQEDYNKQRIDNILNGINSGLIPSLIDDVADWRKNPFQPHFIAQFRTVAYQKAVVMKYVAHLIRHGDYLFTQQTMESVNEATQLYILAAEILGPKPEVVTSPVTTAVDNYYQLEQNLDVLSDAMVDIENLMPQQSITGTPPGAPLPNLQTLYFKIPMNEKMAGPGGYWDTVADRLYKIRHCLSIDGTQAPLSLFAPAIDPGMLVRAASAGLDIGAVLNDMNAPLPLYRFTLMIQKASELCNDVKSLGNALLTALEKKDAESLALLRSGHEIKLLNAVVSIKQKQIQEAQSSIDNLQKQKDLISIRQKYYTGLINTGLINGEKQALTLNKVSFAMEAIIAIGYTASGGLKLLPQFVLGMAGFGGTPHATAETGGKSFGDSAENFVQTLQSIATATDKMASIISTQAGYTRRADEWKFQLDVAKKEMEQIDKQLLGAKIRLQIANQELTNQQLQITQAKQSDEFMHGKFTNEELFSWMITQVSATYFNSYQFAYDIAKKAERCFRYELGIDDSAYINFGYWDSLKKGLLAGDQLGYDIKKLELAYYEQNKRELELTKHISLSQLDPVALLKLKTTGECWVNLPEELFDMDYPGHYMRRIKSVSITIPCITGPYTTVSCKLTMTRNSIRTSGVSTGDANQYPRKNNNDVPADDPRFRDAVGALQSISTSSAQNDSGLFELNFRDERYLPFEGAGAISLWHLQLPAAVRQFDYNTISDAIIHLKYTARDGGEALRTNAAESLTSRINAMLVSTKDKGLMRIFSAKNDLSTEWYRFLHPVTPGGDQVFTLNLDASRFPLFAQGKTIKIRSMELVADSAGAAINGLNYTPAGTPATVSLTHTGAYDNWVNATIEYGSSKKDPGTWTITKPAGNGRLTDSNPQENDILVKNMVIIVHYEIS
jgi:hypothetical protein